MREPKPLPPVPTITTRAERTGPIGPPIHTMEGAAGVTIRFLKEMGADTAGKEHFCVVLLDGDNRLIGIDCVAIGSVNGVCAPLREVFLSAVLTKASTVAFVHNHPSGSLRASGSDLDLDKACKLVGKALGIGVLGSAVVTEGGWRVYSGA
jgi:DNA repair protein RadC